MTSSAENGDRYELSVDIERNAKGLSPSIRPLLPGNGFQSLDASAEAHQADRLAD